MLDFPLWKWLGIVLICLAGVVFTLPNGFYATVERANDARAALDAGLQATPELEAQAAEWPAFLPSRLVNLGLDLRGGAHVLLEVQLSDVYGERIDALWSEVRDSLRENDAIGTVRRVDSPPDQLIVRIGNPEAISQAVSIVNGLTQPVVSLTGVGTRDYIVRQEGNLIIMEMSEAEKTATDDRTMLQTLEIVRRRVDETGTREPTIQRQGSERVLVQVPGLGSAEELIELLGTTAKLTFHEVESVTGDPEARPGAGNILAPSMDTPGEYFILKRRAVVSGEDLVDAQPGFDQNGSPSVNFRFNPSGARKFGEFSQNNVGRPFATVLDGEVITAPVIREAILGGNGQITGNFSVEQSTQLSILLRAGALPAEIIPLEQRTIGPELGADSIAAGQLACMVAFIAVLVYMILSYGIFGLMADIALVLNVALIFALLSVIGATLTLPGIAGIVLTIGMAVDANVLIFERIREELKRAKGPARAIELGYEKAFSAIIDANITTMIAAVILFAIGSGPIKGFSVTLGLGIMTSVFTAIFVTRLMIATYIARVRPKTVEI